ncbi:hypothetical protein ACPCUV_24490 [Streptomyces platensis]|uniref:hypothetical protein n=1 Tax=Streptomyces platensis TaxID=58346 RepID=UPI003C2DBAAD
MTDDDRGGDVITLPVINLDPPSEGPPESDIPTLPETSEAVPPDDFTLPFLDSDGGIGDDFADDVDPEDIAPQMVSSAASGTGSPARATASMAMVTMAAIAVAALRGTWSVASYLKARREHHDAVGDKAREAAGKQKSAGATKGSGRAQSGPEYGRGATKGGGRSGGAGAAGGSGRGAFGQQTKTPGNKTPGRNGSAASGSAGASGRGTDKGRKGSGSSDASGRKGSAGTSSGARGSSGAGSKDGGKSGGSGSGAKGGGGTLGKMALARQARKGADAKAGRQAAADERKADLADRTSARKQVEKDADAKRKRRAEKDKAKRDGDGSAAKDTKKPKKPKAGKDDSEKKPKNDEGDSAAKGGKDSSTDPKKETPGAEKRRWPRWKRKPKTDRKKSSRRRQKPPRDTSGPTGQGAHGKRRKGRQKAQETPSEDGEWLKPPPGWEVTYSVTIDREPAPRRPRGAVGTGTKGLPAGKGAEVTPTRSVPKEGPIVMGSAVEQVGDTQFVDAELTVGDLIESDEEMADQILLGVEHTKLVAERCEGLRSSLEGLYAMCLEKKVPGVLTRWAIRLMERAGVVQDRAEALAASLPRASEAISHAGQVAAEADKHRADAVKDAGHVAPAEREYHDRSGV